MVSNCCIPTEGKPCLYASQNYAMRVLLNCTTLVKGGALQAAASFINETAARQGNIDWHFALSPQVLNELANNNHRQKIERITVVEPSPARSTLSRKNLKKLELSINPNAVFTFFGPAYVRFNAPHLCGVADGWFTHSNWLAFSSLQSKLQIIPMFFHMVYKALWYRKATCWVVEAEVARNGLVKRLFVPNHRISIVKNTCAIEYFSFKNHPTLSIQPKTRILTLSAFYPHKNLEIIPHVAKELIALLQNDKFEFVLTIHKDTVEERSLMNSAKFLSVSHVIKNIGPVKLVDGPQLYSSCQIMFLPSLLETFSANYPEAMSMGLPIVTTNLGFAQDICRDAALYYPPKDAQAAAKCIASVINDGVLREKLISKGRDILKGLPDPSQKYHQYTDILRKMILR